MSSFFAFFCLTGQIRGPECLIDVWEHWVQLPDVELHEQKREEVQEVNQDSKYQACDKDRCGGCRAVV